MLLLEFCCKSINMMLQSCYMDIKRVLRMKKSDVSADTISQLPVI